MFTFFHSAGIELYEKYTFQVFMNTFEFCALNDTCNFPLAWFSPGTEPYLIQCGSMLKGSTPCLESDILSV